jgi:hypothetical protein
MFKKTFYLLVLTAFTISCELEVKDDNIDETNSQVIPSFNISCVSTDASGCSAGANGNNLYIRILKGSCSDESSYYGQGAAAITCINSGGSDICSMTFTGSFQDENSITVASIPKSIVAISAFIDADGSGGTSNTGDPIYCQMVSISGSSATLYGDSWTNKL